LAEAEPRPHYFYRLSLLKKTEQKKQAKPAKIENGLGAA
jgi:hypothetical protein